MKRFFRLVGGALLLLLFAAGGFWVYRSRVVAQGGSSTAAGEYTQVVEVRRGNLSARITVVGQLEAVRQEDMTFSRLLGTTPLLSLTVQAGNTVTVGQVLAAVDPTPYQQALDQARSDLQAAEEKLAELETPATELEIAQADLAVAKAELQLQQAQKDLEDLLNPDIAELQRAVKDAQDNLTLARLQQVLAEHDSLAKSERDLQYAVNWHQRRIAQLQQLVAEHKANLEQVQALADEQEKLNEVLADLAHVQAQRRISLQSAALSVMKAQQTLADAEEALVEARSGGDAEALAKARLAVREAEVALAKAKEERAALEEVDEVALAAARAEVDKKRLAVEEAEKDLAGTVLVAPFDGTVLQTYVKVGEMVGGSTRVLTVADMRELRVVASVDETTIRQVVVGQGAEVTFDALPGRTFRGRVLEVPLQGVLQGNVMVYEVPVSLEGVEGESLLVGMTANVKIEVGRVEGGLLVPTMALTKVGGRYQVLVPNTVDGEGEPEVVPVEVGLSDGTYTQVVRGLNEGDKVLMRITSSQSASFFFRGGPEMMPGAGGGPPPEGPTGR